MANFNFGKHYEHYNRALGKYINNKGEYNEEMKRQGMISSGEANDIASKKQEELDAPYKPSKKCYEIMRACNFDKKGKGKMPDRAVEELKKMGMTFDKAKVEKHIKDGNI